MQFTIFCLSALSGFYLSVLSSTSATEDIVKQVNSVLSKVGDHQNQQSIIEICINMKIGCFPHMVLIRSTLTSKQCDITALLFLF